MFTEALFTIAKAQRQPKCPLKNESIEKILHTHTHTHTHTLMLSSHKKKETLLSVTTRVNLENIELNEIS